MDNNKFRSIVVILLLMLVFTYKCKAMQDEKEEGVSALISSGFTYLLERDYKATDSIISLVKPHIDSLSTSELLFRYYKLKADLYFDRLQINEAILAYERSIQESQKLKDTSKLVSAYSGLANTYIINKRTREAIVYLEQALTYLESNKSIQYYQLLSNIALAYLQVGMYDKALDNYLEVKDFFSKIEDYEGLAIIENNIGELYREYLNEYQLAKKHYRNAITINIKIGNEYRLSQVYNNISLVFSEEGTMDSAFYYLKKTKKIKEKIGDIGGLAIAHNSLGALYAQNGDFNNAIVSFDETLRISEELGIAPGVFFGNLGKGNTYKMMGSNREALIFYLRAKKTAENLEDMEISKAIHEKLFEFYKSTQNFEKALESFENLVTIKDSLNAKQMQETLSDIKVKYETNLAKQENKILREKESAQQEVIQKQNTILYILIAAVFVFLVMVVVLFQSYQQRNKAYQTLRLTSKELEEQYEKVKKQEHELQIRNGLKDKIFSVLGHDLRTPLLNIMGLINSISKVEISKEEFSHVLNHLKNETIITLKNLQNILQWSQLQINDKVLVKKEFDENKVIKEVLNSYQSLASAKNIKLSYVNLKRNPFEADENQFKSIVTNLVANAVKFSPTHSEVSVKFIEESLQYVLEIKDNGSGIDELTVHNLLLGNQVISSKGTSGEIGTGIGLTIVRDFVKLHNGQLEFLDNFPTGTIVRVCFPKENEFV